MLTKFYKNWLISYWSRAVNSGSIFWDTPYNEKKQYVKHDVINFEDVWNTDKNVEMVFNTGCPQKIEPELTALDQ